MTDKQEALLREFIGLYKGLTKANVENSRRRSRKIRKALGKHGITLSNLVSVVSKHAGREPTGDARYVKKINTLAAHPLLIELSKRVVESRPILFPRSP